MEREELQKLIDKNLSIRDICKELDKSYSAVRHWLGKYGLKTNHRPFNAKDYTEEEKEFLPLVHHCEFGRWHPAFVDITALGNTKQNGIDEFIKRFGFTLEETMAFGDGGNDIGMLRHAGIGIAMGNANDEVKAAADYVTASVDEDGIYKALKHFGVI